MKKLKKSLKKIGLQIACSECGKPQKYKQDPLVKGKDGHVVHKLCKPKAQNLCFIRPCFAIWDDDREKFIGLPFEEYEEGFNRGLIITREI